MTDYSALSLEKVLYLHERIVSLTGGKPGMHDFILLHSALERCKVTYFGEDLYPSLLEKAAALLQSLIVNHPFLDGNKRTGYQVMKRFLYVNGRKINTTQKEIVHLCMSIGKNKLDLKNIFSWLSTHSYQI